MTSTINCVKIKVRGLFKVKYYILYIVKIIANIMHYKKKWNDVLGFLNKLIIENIFYSEFNKYIQH